MNKQEIIDYLKGQTEWSGNHHYILVNKSELISLIEDLDELEFKNYLRDIKSQIDYLRIQGPGKVKSLRMLENMVDNMLTGYWSSTSIRTEKATNAKNGYGGIYCDHWGYPDEDMKKVREKAIEIGFSKGLDTDIYKFNYIN